MKIGIVIDHHQRDLNGYLALINKILSEKNYEIYLINLYHLYEIYLIDVDLVILHNSRPENLYIIRDLKKLKKKIVIIDNEGVPFGWSKGDEHIKQFINNIKSSLEYVEAYIVWSNYIKNLMENEKLETNKIYVLGNQRFELFKNKFSYLYKKRKTVKKVIVINTNTPNSNPQFTSIEKDKNDIKKKLYYKLDNSDQLLDEVLKNNRIIFENYLKLIENVLNDFRHHKIILNVHPFEDKKIYKKLFSKKKNILILNNNFNLPQLYNNYDLIVQYNSTTCAETLLNGKKSISVNFVDPNNIVNEFYREFCVNVNDYSTLKSLIDDKKKLEDEIYKINDQTKKILNYVYHNGSNDAIELISNLINQIIFNHQKIKIRKILKYFYFIKYFLSFNYNKIDIAVIPKRILKLLLIFLINSQNFYKLKLLLKNNYKKKHMSIKKHEKFFLKLNKNSNNKFKFFYTKPSFLRIIFRNLITIKIKIL